MIPGCAAIAPETILLTSASDRPSGIWIPEIAACNSAAVIPPAGAAGWGSAPPHATASAITSTSDNIRATNLPNFISTSYAYAFVNSQTQLSTSRGVPTCRWSFHFPSRLICQFTSVWVE